MNPIKDNPVLKFMDLVSDIFFEIFSQINDTTFEDIVEEFSPRIDKIIRNAEYNGLKFIRGLFKFTVLEYDDFVCSYELYFKDKNNNWKKYGQTSEPQSMQKVLSKEARLELKSKKEKVFYIEP